MQLDKYQREAAETDENNVLVVAAPGSGKTTVIVNRVRHLIFDKEIPNRNIIVLTFTKAAAENMKRRFGKEMAPFFGTFHSLFYKILRREGYEVKIVDSSIVFRIVEKIFGKYFDEINEEKVKEIINAISLFKTSNSTMEDFPSPINKNLLREVLEEYTAYLENTGEMDFDDLGIKVLSLFRENEKKLNEYRSIFRYILVDEFQDCDETQIEFLRMINNEGENSLFAVGDEDQCIYSFRGSKPQYMISFNDIFKNGIKYFLTINYRSGRKIVEAAKEIIKFNRERNVKEINPYRKEEGEIVVKYTLSEEEQREEISKCIKEGIIRGEDYNNYVVLYRTNKEAITVIDQLIRLCFNKLLKFD